MSSISATQLDPEAHWITPEQQLSRLPSQIANAVSEFSPLILNLANIVAHYTGDEWVTNWYKALRRLHSLPEKIPPLPETIGQIMEGRCPIYGDQVQKDGTYLKVKDTHFLVLIPQEFQTLHHLQENILKPCEEREYVQQNYLLQCRSSYDRNSPWREHATDAFPETQWVLMTKDVLPESRNKRWQQQVELVEELTQKSFASYRIPTLQQSFAAIAMHRIATEEICYRESDAEIRRQKYIKEYGKRGDNGLTVIDADTTTYKEMQLPRNGDKQGTYTVVQEKEWDFHVAIGGWNSLGLDVKLPLDNDDFEKYGIAAVRLV